MACVTKSHMRVNNVNNKNKFTHHKYPISKKKREIRTETKSYPHPVTIIITHNHPNPIHLI